MLLDQPTRVWTPDQQGLCWIGLCIPRAQHKAEEQLEEHQIILDKSIYYIE